MAEVIEKVKKLRVDVSECIEYTKALPAGSKERELALLRAEEAFMFLGKLLGMLGNESPYPSDHVREVGLKVADTFEGSVKWDSPSTLDNIKQIRIMLQRIISSGVWNELFDITTVKGQPFVKYNSLSWQITSHSLLSLTASKMWFGMMLNDQALRLHRNAEIGAKLPGSQPGDVQDNAAGVVDPESLTNKDNHELNQGNKEGEAGNSPGGSTEGAADQGNTEKKEGGDGAGEASPAGAEGDAANNPGSEGSGDVGSGMAGDDEGGKEDPVRGKKKK